MVKTITACGKPKRCPACGSKGVENVLYSKPLVGSKNSESENTPKWRCTGCGVKIHLRTSKRCRVKTAQTMS